MSDKSKVRGICVNLHYLHNQCKWHHLHTKNLNLIDKTFSVMKHFPHMQSPLNWGLWNRKCTSNNAFFWCGYTFAYMRNLFLSLFKWLFCLEVNYSGLFFWLIALRTLLSNAWELMFRNKCSIFYIENMQGYYVGTFISYLESYAIKNKSSGLISTTSNYFCQFFVLGKKETWICTSRK